MVKYLSTNVACVTPKMSNALTLLRVSTYKRTYTCLRTHKRTHTYIYVFRYVCMYVIMYTHIHKECARVLLQTDEHPAHGIFVYVVYIQIYV